MGHSPIFIHSLFRAGSTYIFNVFRRSSAGYCCYQEPLHEVAFFAKDNIENLLVGFGEHESALLRHPLMDRPYFQELYEAGPECLRKLNKKAVYDNYFAPDMEDIGIPYWNALIGTSVGRPVFQECRTASRIGAIKKEVGGKHVYLWRNPWDQWWSYKINDYFCAISQLIINAPHHPEVVARLRQEIGFVELQDDDLAAQFHHFMEQRQSAEVSYLVFYTLWCLGLREGLQHSDVLLNIDRLSDSPEYQSQILHELQQEMITGLDFSDCQVPQTIYAKSDQLFFERLEAKVYGLLLLSGWTKLWIDRLIELRQEFEPACRMAPATKYAEKLLTNGARARELCIRIERRESDYKDQAESCIFKYKQLVAIADAKTEQVESKLNESRAHTAQVESELSESRAHAAKVESELSESRAHAAQVESELIESRAYTAQVESELAESRSHAAQVEFELVESRDHAQWLENEWNAAKGKVDELNHNCHHWWSVADGLDRELKLACGSRSWRYTKPLRVFSQILRRWRAVVCSVPYALKQGIKSLIKPVLAQGIRFVMERPALKAKVMSQLWKYPAIEARLRRFAVARGLASGLGLKPHSSGVNMSPEFATSTPTLRAQQIYNELKAAIDNNRGTH